MISQFRTCWHILATKLAYASNQPIITSNVNDGRPNLRVYKIVFCYTNQTKNRQSYCEFISLVICRFESLK